MLLLGGIFGNIHINWQPEGYLRLILLAAWAVTIMILLMGVAYDKKTVSSEGNEHDVEK